MKKNYLLLFALTISTSQVFAITVSGNLANSATSSFSNTSTSTATSGATTSKSVSDRVISNSTNAKIFAKLKAGLFATLNADGTPKACHVVNVSRGPCKQAYISPGVSGGAPVMKCIQYRPVAASAIPVTATAVNATARANFALSLGALNQTAIQFTLLNPESLAVSHFKTDFAAGKCNVRNSSNITNVALSDYKIENVGEGKDINIFSDPSSPLKYTCISYKNTTKIMNKDCNLVNFPVKLSVPACRLVLNRIKAQTRLSGVSAESATTGGTSSPVVSVPHIFPAMSAQLIEQLAISENLAKPDVAFNLNSAVFEASLVDLTIPLQTQPKFLQIAAKVGANEQFNEITGMLATDLGALSELTAAVAAIDAEVAFSGASISSLGANFQSAYNAIKSHASLSPLIAAVPLNAAIHPRTEVEFAPHFNAQIGNLIPTAIATNIWQVTNTPSMPRPIRPKACLTMLAAPALTLALANTLVQDTGVPVNPQTPPVIYSNTYSALMIEANASEK